MSVGDNRLAVLGAEIKSAHDAACRAIGTALQHGMAAGDMLIEAKAHLGHGKWLPWLKAHCEISERTAQQYMRLARHRAEIDSKSATAADLTLRGAVDMLAPTPTADEIEDLKLGRLAEGEAWLPIGDVIWRPEVHARKASFNPSWAEELTNVLDLVPAIEINQRREIIDGWHRWQAHLKLGATEISTRTTNVANDLQHMMLSCERNSSNGPPYMSSELTPAGQAAMDDDHAKVRAILARVDAYVPQFPTTEQALADTKVLLHEAAEVAGFVDFEQHEISKIYPTMKAWEFEALCKSVATAGLRHPIILFEGKVLDGWMRQLACRQTGTPARYQRFTGAWDEAIELTVSANLRRQHLTESQRACISVADGEASA